MFPKSRMWAGAYPKCMLRIDSINGTYSLHFARDAAEELRVLGCCAKWSECWSGQSCHTGDGRLLGSIRHNTDGSIIKLHGNSHHMYIDDHNRPTRIDHTWLVYGHVAKPERSVYRLRDMLNNAKFMLFGDGQGGTYGDPEAVAEYAKSQLLSCVPTFNPVGNYTIDDLIAMFAATDTPGVATPRDEDQIEVD